MRALSVRMRILTRSRSMYGRGTLIALVALLSLRVLRSLRMRMLKKLRKLTLILLMILIDLALCYGGCSPIDHVIMARWDAIRHARCA